MRKTKSFLFTASVALAMAFIFSCTSSDIDDIGGGGGNSSFSGAWNAGGERSIVFDGNSFTYKVKNVTQYSGTFSVSGSTITFNESSLGTASGNFSLSENTLTLSNHTWDNSVNGTYTRADVNGGGNSSSSLAVSNISSSSLAVSSISSSSLVVVSSSSSSLAQSSSSSSSGSATPNIASFSGTWNASGERSIVFTGNAFTYKVKNATQYSGTFSFSGSTITFNESSLGTASGNFSLSENALTLSNHTWDSNVNGAYTKDNGGGGSSSSSSLMSSSSPSPSGGKGNNIANYETVTIGSQTWMAENLDYAVEGSKCYNNQDSNCDTYGRLYDWATAMDLPSSCNPTSCASQINAKHRGVCPSGWHIPSDDEWRALVNSVGGSSTAGKHLKAKNGWSSCGPSGSGSSYSCEDTYGFAALPGGGGLSGGSFHDVGNSGDWWSSTEYLSKYAYYRYMYYSSENVGSDYSDRGNLLSVRCVQD